MVDVAQEAVRSQKFGLASEIYERIILEKGPAAHLLIELGNCLALDGRISEAFTAFLKAYRLGKVNPDDLKQLVKSLVKLTREMMEEVTDADGNHSLLLDTQELLEREPFFCGICLGTIIEPTTVYCGHTFCKKCIDKSGHNSCVCCGSNPDITGGFRPNVLLADIVAKLFPRMEDIIKLKREANEKFNSGEIDEALTAYDEIIKMCDSDHTIWSNRSYAHYIKGNYDNALEDAWTAVKLRPQWAKGYYRKGVSEEALNRPEEAAISYMKCLAIDSNTQQQANHNLTQILHNLLKPNMNSENLKHTPVPTKEPVSELMGAGNSEHGIQHGLSAIKDLLDKQFRECDSELKFSSEVNKIDPSLITIGMFDCSLCYRLLHKPVTTPCGHVFCQHCLDRSMDHSVSCPSCRGPLSEYLAHRNRSITISIQRIINLWFPEQVKERKKLHDEDMAAFSLAGNTAEIPVFVCTLAFPTLSCPLHVFEPRYRLMMRQVMESGVRQFGMCIGSGDSSFSDYGTMLEICDLQFFDDGRSVVDTVGGRRFRVISRGMRDGYHVAKVEFLDEVKVHGSDLRELQVFHDQMYNKVREWLTALPHRITSRIRGQFGEMPPKDTDLQALRLGPKWVWWVTALLPVDTRVQLSLLSMNSLKDRLSAIDRVISFLHSRQ